MLQHFARDNISLTESSTSSKIIMINKKQKPSLICKRLLFYSFIAVLFILILLFLILWMIIPISFMLSIPFETFSVFLPINSPRNANFDKPEEFGLTGVYNFYLPVIDIHDNNINTSIGAWLLLQENDAVNSIINTNNVTHILQNTTSDILVYLHGIFANRAKALKQYKVLRKHFTIIAIDHRGYGDSGVNVPMTEKGIVNDHIQIYKWIKSINPYNNIYYWGHSLGSGIGAHTVKLLNEQNVSAPTGLVLESSFTTLEDILINIFVGKIFSWLPYFDSTFLHPLLENGFHFYTKNNVEKVNSPIMILHAEDDAVVPYFLGQTLGTLAKENRNHDQGQVVFHGICAEYGFGHNEILLHPRMDEYIDNFKRICEQFKNSS